jgi:DNA-binding YbaB/EbfC family protein
MADDASGSIEKRPTGDDGVIDDDVIDAEIVDEGEAGGGMDDLLGALGGLDMNSLLGSAMQIQQQMLSAQQEAASTEVEGQSGGGVVKVTTTGDFDFRKVVISPEAVDPDDVEMLQDLVLAAIRDAVSEALKLTQSGLGDLGGLAGMAGLGGTAGGMDLSGLFGGLATDDEDEHDDEDEDDDDVDDEVHGDDDGGAATP